MRAPRLLITAGPTQEPIDEVRYLSNRSSGRLGIELALRGAERGWPTTLLLGPVGPLGAIDPTLADASGLRVVRFRTAADLGALLHSHWPEHDVLVMAAAVADWRPKTTFEGKLRRDAERPPSIELEPVPDLLAELSATTRPEQTVIGFALEPPDRLAASALEKLRRKRLDGIVANPLETMDSESIEPTLLCRNGRRASPDPKRQSKREFASWLLDEIVALRQPPPRSNTGRETGHETGRAPGSGLIA